VTLGTPGVPPSGTVQATGTLSLSWSVARRFDRARSAATAPASSARSTRSRLGISRPALEKIERGRNVFSAALRNKVFVATGTCPGWLAHQQGPLHTADGYAITPAELARWEAWLEVKLPAGEDQASPIALGGHRLGPCYRRDCCPGPERLPIHGPLDIPRTGTVAARRLQKNLQCEQRRQLCNHLIDRARGIAQRALATWDDAEKPLWELLGAMDRNFSNVPPVADPTKAKASVIFSPPNCSTNKSRKSRKPAVPARDSGKIQ